MSETNHNSSETVAVATFGAGGLIGAALARTIGHEHARHLNQRLKHSGLPLWVRTCDAERSCPLAN